MTKDFPCWRTVPFLWNFHVPLIGFQCYTYRLCLWRSGQGVALEKEINQPKDEIPLKSCIEKVLPHFFTIFHSF